MIQIVTMSAIQFQSPINRILEEAFNQGNLDVVDELLTPDHLAHNTFAGHQMAHRV